MVNLSKLTKNTISHKEIDFYNISKQNIFKLQKDILELIDNCFLVVTAVDGSIDHHYLKTYLQKDNIKFELFKQAYLIYPESITKFINYILEIPESSFFCCVEKPAITMPENITQGYAEEMGNIKKNNRLVQLIYNKMKELNAKAYLSQGDCNLLIAIKNNV